MTDEQLAQDIEMRAAYRSYECGLGVSEWESFLTLAETRQLIELAGRGFGTWGREPQVLESIKLQVARIEEKTVA
jgi:hypothetical protein